MVFSPNIYCKCLHIVWLLAARADRRPCNKESLLGKERGAKTGFVSDHFVGRKEHYERD